MQQNTKGVSGVVGLSGVSILGDPYLAESARPLNVFSAEAIEFLDDVSRVLLKTPQAKAYPDVVTFGFWCRKASILGMKGRQGQARNSGGDEGGARVGLGLAFHISPSNVPVNFAYSLVTGLLAGNANIVRVPSKPFEQVDIIKGALRSAAEKHPQMAPYVSLVRYGHEKSITDAFSAMCDLRIIWGGDATIAAIRESPLKARAREITFADRYSIAVIDARHYLEDLDGGNRKKIAEGFYNDTYLTDQNACTSPKLVVWLGDGKELVSEAQKLFWEELAVVVGEKYELGAAQAVMKLAALFKIGAAGLPAAYQGAWVAEGSLDCFASLAMTEVDGPDGLVGAAGPGTSLMRVAIESLSPETMAYAFHSGFFLEYATDDLGDLLPVCGKQCQTVGYLGSKEAIVSFIESCRPAGVDRVVPIGKTMDFSLSWDGYDLIEAMSRRIVFE